MHYLIKYKILSTWLTLALFHTSHSQTLETGPFHFDQHYAQTDPQNAVYKGYIQKVKAGFITTIYTRPLSKIATLTYADKALTQRHGEITGYHEQGAVMFTSHYKKNRLHGKWVSWYQNATACDAGNFKNNIPDGVWQTWYSDGTRRSIRTYNAFKYQSLLDEVRRNNPRLSFFFLTALARKNKHVLNLYTSAGYSYNTLPTGKQSYGGNLPLKELAEINTDTENQGYVPPFSKSLHDGLYMNFYANGMVKDSGYYKNGLRDGIWEEWLEAGSIRSTGFYQHGLKRNTWKFYNDSGKLLYYQHYDRHGKPDHAKEFPE